MTFVSEHIVTERPLVRVKRRDDALVRVADGYLECVAFVGEVLGGSLTVESFDPEMTGFFVAIPSETAPGKGVQLFVTAKHVAQYFEGKNIGFLVNKINGGTTLLGNQSIVGTRWYMHPDPSVDVAVFPVNKDPLAYHRSVSVGEFLTPSLMHSEQIGIGDEVFFPGLFSLVPGREKLLPILRTGSIAMLPTEQIQIENNFTEAYLIEARSIAGISGSPVFVRGTSAIRLNDSNGNPASIAGTRLHPYLLGMIHGHWDVKESDLNKSRPKLTDKWGGVNMGIAIVIPAHKILEVINDPELVAMRQEAKEAKGTDTNVDLK